MKIQGIYKIVNCINNKVYIGQSIDIEKRFQEHKYNIKTNIKHPLYKSIRKYGIGNFEFIIIEHVINDNELNKREQHWLDYYNSYEKDFGYNICRESTTTRGYVHTDETKKKFSETHKGKKLSEEHKRSFSWLGKKHTEETRKKMSKVQKGKKLSEEHRLKISENSKKQWADPLNRENLSKIKNNLYKNNPEIKKKISNSVKKLWKDENYRNNQMSKRKGIIYIFLDLNKVKDLYITQNFTMQQVAAILGVCSKTVSNFLKENNIQKPYSAYSKNKIRDCDINKLFDATVTINQELINENNN